MKKLTLEERVTALEAIVGGMLAEEEKQPVDLADAIVEALNAGHQAFKERVKARRGEA